MKIRNNKIKHDFLNNNLESLKNILMDYIENQLSEDSTNKKEIKKINELYQDISNSFEFLETLYFITKNLPNGSIWKDHVNLQGLVDGKNWNETKK